MEKPVGIARFRDETGDEIIGSLRTGAHSFLSPDPARKRSFFRLAFPLSVFGRQILIGIGFATSKKVKFYLAIPQTGRWQSVVCHQNRVLSSGLQSCRYSSGIRGAT
ncbi:MAG: hypothetical protein GXP01_06175 [Alphaproteobacteria bacterium]|nr:hypothetical protein [Alphaproteobacteria bacterium]